MKVEPAGDWTGIQFNCGLRIDMNELKAGGLFITLQLGGGKSVKSEIMPPKKFKVSEELNALADLDFLNKRTFESIQAI